MTRRDRLIEALSGVDVPYDRDASYTQVSEAVERMADAALGALCCRSSDRGMECDLSAEHGGVHRNAAASVSWSG